MSNRQRTHRQFWSKLQSIASRAWLDREKNKHAAAWLRPDFVRDQHITRRRHRLVESWRDWLPGTGTPDSCYLTLAATIAGYLPRFTFPEQSALPYYDRDLFQFLISIPYDQLLRPRQRRSLMRRGLRETVPCVILERKTKWLGQRQPALQILDNAFALHALLTQTPMPFRYLNPAKIEDDFARLRQGKQAPLLLLERVLGTCFLYATLDQRHLWRSSCSVQTQSLHQPEQALHES